MQTNHVPDAPSKMARPVLVTLVLALSGCGQLLGADEYGFADEGNRENPCAADQVPTDEGGCDSVGVRNCASGFKVHPEGGCTATLPPTDCAEGIAGVGALECGPWGDNCAQDDPFPGVGNLSGASVVYADADAAAGGTGAQDHPFNTIAEGLVAAELGRPLRLLIKGTFLEDVVITRPDVTIRSCARAAAITGQKSIQKPEDPCFPKGLEKLKKFRSAAVCLTGIENVTLEGFEITGKGDGVRIAGAKAVSLQNLHIHDTDYFGVRIEDSSDVKLDHVAIYRAHGAGVQLEGSKLVEIAHSSIQHTVPLNDWADDKLRMGSPEASKVPEYFRVGWARGVSIHSGSWPRDASHEEDFASSDVTIKQSVLTGHKEMAVFVAGATLTLDGVFLGATSAGEGSGRGLVAERSLPTGRFTHVTVLGTVIERASDAAIDVRDATLKLEETTLRDTRGRAGDGCSGQGIRVRTWPTPDTWPTGDVRAIVEATNSTIAGSRQAGIFAASSKVNLTRVHIRDVKPSGMEGPCRLAMGDGIALERYSGQEPSHAEFRDVRIEGAERAAITTGGAEIDLGSTLLACNGKDIVDATGQAPRKRVPGAVCGCQNAWSACVSSAEALDSWIVSGPSAAWPDATALVEYCATDFFGGNPAAGVVISSMIRPEIAPVVTAPNGCTFGATGAVDELSGRLQWRPGDFALAGAGTNAVRLISAYAPPLTLATRLSWPATTSLLTVQRAPAESLLTVGADVWFGDIEGNVLDDGRVPASKFGAIGNVFYATAFEPGWHTLDLSELPEGVTCASTPAARRQLGVETKPTARFVRAEWGVHSIVEFRDCAAPAPVP